jgi:hypothetical protein
LKDIDTDISREEFTSEYVNVIGVNKKHNALYDAEVIRLCHKKLTLL